MSDDADPEVFIPDWDDHHASFPCPECGMRVDRPFGGHTWTCHESYGGCGASFRPVKAFKRVDSGDASDE